MNILIINHYAGSPEMGMEFRPYYLAREWISKGHNVTIACSSESHLRVQSPKILKSFTINNYDGINYLWIKTSKYSGNGFGRIKNMLSFVFQLYFKAKNISDIVKPDIVIASSTYPLDIYPAKKIAKYSNAKTIYEVHDLWPLSPMELGGFSKYHPFIMILQKAENYACKNSDFVVSILPNTLSHLCDHGLKPSKFYHIPNGIYLDDLKIAADLPNSINDLLAVLRIKEKFIVGYVGSIGLANAIDYLIESAKIAPKNVAFVLVGKGQELEYFKNLCNTYQLSNVFFVPPVPKTSVHVLLKKFDILYIGWRKNPLYRFGISANKLFDYMISGIPILHSVHASNDPISESNSGISVEPESPILIVNAIREFIEMTPDQRSELGNNGIKYALSNFDYKILSQKFLNIFLK